MNSSTSSHARALLNFMLKGTALALDGQTATWSAAPALFLGLFTSAPSEAGGGTEVTGNAYARKALAAADWASASTANDVTSSTNVNALTFATPSPAGWGTVTHVGIFDKLTGGTLLFVASLASSAVVTASNAPVIAVGGITVTLD